MAIGAKQWRHLKYSLTSSKSKQCFFHDQRSYLRMRNTIEIRRSKFFEGFEVFRRFSKVFEVFRRFSKFFEVFRRFPKFFEGRSFSKVSKVEGFRMFRSFSSFSKVSKLIDSFGQEPQKRKVKIKIILKMALL